MLHCFSLKNNLLKHVFTATKNHQLHHLGHNKKELLCALYRAHKYFVHRAFEIVKSLMYNFVLNQEKCITQQQSRKYHTVVFFLNKLLSFWNFWQYPYITDQTWVFFFICFLLHQKTSWHKYDSIYQEIRKCITPFPYMWISNLWSLPVLYRWQMPDDDELLIPETQTCFSQYLK